MGGAVSSTSGKVASSGPSLKFRRSSTVNQPEVSVPGSGNTWQPNPDQFETLESVQESLKQAGLVSSNLILGIDFTKVCDVHPECCNAVGDMRACRTPLPPAHPQPTHRPPARLHLVSPPSIQGGKRRWRPVCLYVCVVDGNCI